MLVCALAAAGAGDASAPTTTAAATYHPNAILGVVLTRTPATAPARAAQRAAAAGGCDLQHHDGPVMHAATGAARQLQSHTTVTLPRGAIGEDGRVHGVDLVIFDCDGVLVDSEPISARILAAALRAEGLPTTEHQARRRYQGLQLAEMVERIETELGRRLPAHWLARFKEQRADVFRRELRAVPGAAGAVERIAGAGVQVCVASQAGLEKTRLSLGLTGLAPLFPDGTLFSAALVARGKPHPDLFLHAAAHLRAEPSRCVVVEDSPSGVAAAISAGMRVLVYTADPGGPPLHETVAEPLGALGELPGRLGID